MIFVTPRFLNFLQGRGLIALAIFPFVFVRDLETKENKITIHHEKIHIRQQLELLIIPFFILYFGFYFYYRLKGFNHFNAYMTIPFEREAYKQESNFDYLSQRNWAAWSQMIV